MEPYLGLTVIYAYLETNFTKRSWLNFWNALPEYFDPYLRNTHKYDANDHRDTTLRRPPLGGPNALLANI